MSEDDIKNRIDELEIKISSPNFWEDKVSAKKEIQELKDLKDRLEGGLKYDKGNCVINIFSGAGGDDAEDFSAMLFGMYTKYIENKNFDFHSWP